MGPLFRRLVKIEVDFYHASTLLPLEDHGIMEIALVALNTVCYAIVIVGTDALTVYSYRYCRFQ